MLCNNNYKETTMEEYLWEISPNNEERIKSLIEEANVTRPIALVLDTRGITTENVFDFLNPSLDSIGDPYLLPGTKEASVRIWQAIMDGQRILIHGDYDTDGITASALLASASSRRPRPLSATARSSRATSARALAARAASSPA